MGNKNILIRIWEGLIFFLKTITGIEARDSLNDLRKEFLSFRKELETKNAEHFQLAIKQFQVIHRLSNKAFFPVLLNSKGMLTNLLMQEHIKAEMVYDANDKSLNVELHLNHRLFEKYDLDLDESYKNSVNSPLMGLARIKFTARDRKFMDECTKNFTYGIIAFAFSKEVLQSDDVLEILGKTILQIVRPEYIKENKLKDFIIDKGPVEMPEEEITKTEELKFHPAGTFQVNEPTTTNEA